jgi:type III pantothenate kinase
MNLIIDLGNTNKKLALFQNGKLSDLQIFPELELTLLKDFIIQHQGIVNCILSSVVDHPESFNIFLSEQFHFIELNENTTVPIRNLYKQPKTLGKDRLAASVAGASIFPKQNVLVVNLGSCITYDFVNSRTEYLGGAISPGMQMRFKALNTFTGKLPLVSHKETESLLGIDTESSILTGVVNGIIHEIEGTVSEYRKQFRKLKVILGGGDLNYFDKRLKISIFAVPNIVIEGLYQILAFNVKKNI